MSGPATQGKQPHQDSRYSSSHRAPVARSEKVSIMSWACLCGDEETVDDSVSARLARTGECVSSSCFSAQVAPGAPSIKVVTFSAKAPVGLDLETHDTNKTIVVKNATPGSIAANVSV